MLLAVTLAAALVPLPSTTVPLQTLAAAAPPLLRCTLPEMAAKLPRRMATRLPRRIVFRPRRLAPHELALAVLLDVELTNAIVARARKQKSLGQAEHCMAVYVNAPVAEKAEVLERWARLVLDNVEVGAIAEDAASATISDSGSGLVQLVFDRSKYPSPREEAEAALGMAAKLRRQQAKVDSLRHRNEGAAAALAGWQKRVRIAAARGEAEALRALRVKLLRSSKQLGLRHAKIAEFGQNDEWENTLGI